MGFDYLKSQRESFDVNVGLLLLNMDLHPNITLAGSSIFLWLCRKYLMCLGVKK